MTMTALKGGGGKLEVTEEATVVASMGRADTVVSGGGGERKGQRRWVFSSN